MTGQSLLQQKNSGYEVTAKFSDGSEFVGRLTSLPEVGSELSVETVIDALVAAANAGQLDVDVGVNAF